MNFYYFCSIHAFACSFIGVIWPKFVMRLLLKSTTESRNECLMTQLFCALVVGFSFLYFLMGKGADNYAGHRAMILGKYSVFLILSIAYFHNMITILAFATGCTDGILACYALYKLSSSPSIYSEIKSIWKPWCSSTGTAVSASIWNRAGPFFWSASCFA